MKRFLIAEVGRTASKRDRRVEFSIGLSTGVLYPHRVTYAPTFGLLGRPAFANVLANQADALLDRAALEQGRHVIVRVDRPQPVVVDQVTALGVDLVEVRPVLLAIEEQEIGTADLIGAAIDIENDLAAIRSHATHALDAPLSFLCLFPPGGRGGQTRTNTDGECFSVRV